MVRRAAARRSQQGRRQPRRGGPAQGRAGRGRPRDRDRPKPRTPGRGKPVPRGAEATSGASAPAAHEPRRPDREREHVEYLYGRNPIFEALRAGRREIKRIWATAGAAKEPWLDGILLEPADGDWLTQRCGSDAHQGLVADVGPYPYADPAVAAARAGAADRRARRDPGSAEPRRDRPLGRGGGRQRDRHPAAAQRRSHRRGGQGVGGRGRAPQDRPGPQPRRLPRRGQGRRAAGSTARRPRAARTASPTTPAASCW